jgi:hypothetical protein
MSLPKILIATLIVVPLIAGVAQSGQSEKDEMNDRFAVETFDPPARGFVKTELVQNGGTIEILKMQMENLEGDRDYTFLVVVGPPVGFAPFHFKEELVRSTSDGHLKVKNFHVGNFDPGTYRVDILLLQTGATVNSVPQIFDRALSGCDPFPLVTVQ